MGWIYLLSLETSGKKTTRRCDLNVSFTRSTPKYYQFPCTRLLLFLCPSSKSVYSHQRHWKLSPAWRFPCWSRKYWWSGTLAGQSLPGRQRFPPPLHHAGFLQASGKQVFTPFLILTYLFTQHSKLHLILWFVTANHFARQTSSIAPLFKDGGLRPKIGLLFQPKLNQPSHRLLKIRMCMQRANKHAFLFLSLYKWLLLISGNSPLQHKT